ncbi:hypothetical protein CC1G_10990 [Coprinopsis cinerea okayama7|uniref:DUF6533 domain-containing protein n=1 Tax=Coprinopsis cinerea (strain Okayama-7 / 130 / ATCC MYA-4618 / FGSC 9003) TaxID=240176 RepID=A8P715_COPC7|nr:hypothetical protein CC1G_10990 [Coprinopsis cinerea okayama7\|eukprot:XP_001839268.2 hypothetical protein CC1G_10990 [Coprinopsis cinerea okayama7\
MGGLLEPARVRLQCGEKFWPLLGQLQYHNRVQCIRFNDFEVDQWPVRGRKGLVLDTLYDWLSALPLEVEHIWKSRWGLVKSIFIFGRVLFPLHSISTLIYAHSPVLTKAECHSVFAVGSTVIYLQVYALSQGNRWMGIFLGIQFVAFAIAVAILQALFFKSMAYMVLPFEGFHCIPFKFHNGLATATYNAAIATESEVANQEILFDDTLKFILGHRYMELRDLRRGQGDTALEDDLFAILNLFCLERNEVVMVQSAMGIADLQYPISQLDFESVDTPKREYSI